MSEKLTYEELEQQIQQLRLKVAQFSQIEKGYKQNQIEFNVLFNKAPLVMLVVDREGFVCELNEAAVKMTRRLKESSIGLRGGEALRCISSLDDPRGCGFSAACKSCVIRNTVMDTFRYCHDYRSVEAPMPYDVEEGIVDMWVLVSTTFLKLPAGDRVFVCLEDITEQKQVAESLRESEEQYKSLVINLSVGIFRNTQGTEGKFFEANPAIVKMFGFDSREEFLKLKVSDLYKNPSDRKKYNEKLLKEGAVKNEELLLQKKDGTSFIGSVTAVVVKDKKDKTKYYDGLIEDVTERKQAETAIRQSEEKYRTVLEANPDPVAVYDIEGKVIYLNPAFTDVFGWTLEERLGKKNDAFVPEETWRETKEMIDKVVAGERFSSVETFRYNKKGEIIPVSISGAIYKDQNDNPIGSIINLRDISNQKRMESQLQQAQKMESIGTLAGGIAHDFNNILFPVLGYAEMLLEDVSEDSPFKDSLKGIYTSALRGKALVKQILTFSRQNTSELKLMKMQPIVKEALKLIRSTIPTTIEIKQDINPDCGVIKADPTQIHQIIMNLATNAYHAMEETGGELRVSLKEIKFETLDLINPDMKPGPYACLIVADTGMGMDKTVTDKIFDPFFTTKAIGKGTGMGLAVVHGIITVMGGAIHVYSEPGKGTQFHVYLPVEKSLSEEQATASKLELQGGIEQILLVDDEQAILIMGKRMLTRLGYQVTSRTSSLEALEAFRSNPDKFDMVITDMAMPNMSGDKLSVEMNRIRPGIPVLLCTGFSEIMSEEKAASLGIKGFILKPILMRDLAQKIREVLDENNA